MFTDKIFNNGNAITQVDVSKVDDTTYMDFFLNLFTSENIIYVMAVIIVFMIILATIHLLLNMLNISSLNANKVAEGYEKLYSYIIGIFGGILAILVFLSILLNNFF